MRHNDDPRLYNPTEEMLLGVIGLKQSDIERYRGCDVNEAGDEIIVTTRTGGENRIDFPNEILRSNPHFIYDEDDEIDHTYAYFHFRVPDAADKCASNINLNINKCEFCAGNY